MAQTVERGAAFLENVRDETKSRQSKPRTRRGTAGLIVVDTIGESGSKMGEILSNRYKDIVGKPVGWAGKLPAPGHVRDEMTKLWPWAAKVALEIERELAIMRSSRGQNVRLKPILLVGNAGSGKTTMAKWLSEQLGVKQLLLSCAGLTDNGGLTAIGREWTGARPSLIVSTMLENDQCNPFVILDEIDKVATSQQNGSMQDALLGMVESNNFFDTCLMTRVDLAGVTFVGTANDLKMVKGPLCDRFTILDVPDPRAEDFDVILENVRLSFAGERDIPLDRLPQLGDVNVLRGRKLFTGGGSIRGLRQFYSETIGDLLLAIEEQGQHMDYEETSQEGGFQEPTLTLVQ